MSSTRSKTPACGNDFRRTRTQWPASSSRGHVVRCRVVFGVSFDPVSPHFQPQLQASCSTTTPPVLQGIEAATRAHARWGTPYPGGRGTPAAMGVRQVVVSGFSRASPPCRVPLENSARGSRALPSSAVPGRRSPCALPGSPVRSLCDVDPHSKASLGTPFRGNIKH